MTLAFRNVDVFDEAVQSWPYEAIVTAIERGTHRGLGKAWGGHRRLPLG